MHPTAKFVEAEPAPANSKLGQRSLELIGNTPLLRLERIAGDLPNVQILGKAEWYNPGGSVKDRAAFSLSHGRFGRSGNGLSRSTMRSYW